jgi:hypothetical protein
MMCGSSDPGTLFSDTCVPQTADSVQHVVAVVTQSLLQNV